jgi:hypothetical protein
VDPGVVTGALWRQRLAPRVVGRRPRSRTLRAVCAIAAAALLGGCLALSPLPEHRPLAPKAGLGIVYGRIAVRAHGVAIPPANPGADWRAIGLGARPELRLYLERLAPRRVALPPVSGTGLFAWPLVPGDYLLLSLPEEDVGVPPGAQRFRPVAALRVPSGGPWCVGALDLAAAGPVVVDRGPLRVDPSVERASVVDRCAEIAREVAMRYAALASPVAKRLMTVVDDLAFDDPRLSSEVRRRLDAVAGPDAH